MPQPILLQLLNKKLLCASNSDCVVFTETSSAKVNFNLCFSEYLLIIPLNFVLRNGTKFLLLGLTP